MFRFSTIKHLASENLIIQTKTKIKKINRFQIHPHQYWLAKTTSMEKPFLGEYCDHNESGSYWCKLCDNPLFSSEHKFSVSVTGWASFWNFYPKSLNLLDQTTKDQDNQMRYVSCSVCKNHLGRVNFDGPPPTMLRFSINSIMLQFVQQDKEARQINKLKRKPIKPLKFLKNHSDIVE